MWIAYAGSIDVVDLKSGVASLWQLSFDAYHEANYGMGRFLSEGEGEFWKR